MQVEIVKNMKKQTKGITLIALVVTIIVLLILAGIAISLSIGNNGIFKRAENATGEYNKATVKEELALIIGEYPLAQMTGETDSLENFLLSKGAESVIDKGDGTIEVEYKDYLFVVNKETEKIVEAKEAGGIRPTFEIKTTKTDGKELTGDETEKAITINITNIAEFGDDYIIEVKDSSGNTITKEPNVIAGVTGQASYKITKKGNYTIKVTGTKDGIARTAKKTECITMVKPQIAETAAFSRANGVIDIVWLDTNNNVKDQPMSPASYLGGLTAITYDEEKEDWVVADTTNKNDSWYKYKEQTGTTVSGGTSNWANARSSDKNAYFVWIPRYAYKITYFDSPDNANAYRENSSSREGIIGYSNIEGMIDVQSGTEKLVTGSEPINVTGTVKDSQYSDYIPHPAFEFGGEKAGIWVGKFEPTGSKTAIKILPNKSSLTSIKVGEIFTACQGVKTTYHLTGDTHMMKNTEWGACSYLAESKYGRNGTKIAMNKSNDITGAGDYIANALQSTTGNINGIYDMNGTSCEYVAGILSSEKSKGSNYNFSNSVTYPNKYFDWYKGISSIEDRNYKENKNIKGDGMYETSTSGVYTTSWHGSSSNFTTSSCPVFLRDR